MNGEGIWQKIACTYWQQRRFHEIVIYNSHGSGHGGVDRILQYACNLDANIKCIDLRKQDF